MSAVTDLTASACTKRDRDMGQPDGIFCQSVGSVLRKASGGTFPLNLSYHLVKYFDGPNDGLVGEKSFRWGENYTLLEIKEQRGVSHADMIDLNRENISGFDVREFYVQLVHDLKMRGL
jgi:triacylglycerol lipase